jgi:mono/diheme cytochrome c family protein
MKKKLSIALLILLGYHGTAYSLDREQERAQRLLKTLCGSCHAVGPTGRSPHPLAPAFHSLGETKLYEEGFGQRLQDGLSTMHPDMPTFHFKQRDAEAVIDYLRAIQDKRRR